ncbi:aromatic amino acid beta-eliminating lyase/threonine aldolase [Martensiomyces pterosporus]|nr:aromatic amino acid beta-eliminating lyase/threonine aldolase [Martensiomyces pterosporus]
MTSIELPPQKPNWDLRSDTATKPTPSMLQAMLDAPLGDDVFLEDPTVNQLESRVAQLCGKESALFCTSSTMSNQLAIRTHLHNPPESLICHRESHIFEHESGGASLHSHAMMVPVAPKKGFTLTLEDVKEEFIEDTFYGHAAPTHLVCLENTMTGVVMPLEDIKEIGQFAREKGVPVHMDGARLWNASIATGISLAEYASEADSLNLCLSKGMGCPVGAVLVGSKAFIAKARHFRKAFGGGWRQAGILAAAGLYAIDHIWPAMGETHARAKRLADGLQELGFKLAMPVDTNMVVIEDAEAKTTADQLSAALKPKGITMGTTYAGSTRIVIHHQIDDECIDLVLETAKELTLASN